MRATSQKGMKKARQACTERAEHPKETLFFRDAQANHQIDQFKQFVDGNRHHALFERTADDAHRI